MIGALVPAVLGGRCANGYERDQGRVVHLVHLVSDSQPNDCISTSVCGQRHGARSVGYVPRRELRPTCRACQIRAGGIFNWREA